MAQKRIGSLEDDALIIGALVIGGIFAIKAIPAMFGIDPANENEVKDQKTVDQSENPFSPFFQPLLDYLAANQPAGLTVADVMQQLKQLGDSGQLQPGQSGYDVWNWANIIRGAFSMWNIWPHYDVVVGVFNQMTNQTQCASLAAYFAYNYNEDLLTYLHSGGSLVQMIPMGLNYDQIAIIVKQINNLPE